MQLFRADGSRPPPAPPPATTTMDQPEPFTVVDVPPDPNKPARTAWSLKRQGRRGREKAATAAAAAPPEQIAVSVPPGKQHPCTLPSPPVQVVVLVRRPSKRSARDAFHRTQSTSTQTTRSWRRIRRSSYGRVSARGALVRLCLITVQRNASPRLMAATDEAMMNMIHNGVATRTNDSTMTTRHGRSKRRPVRTATSQS